MAGNCQISTASVAISTSSGTTTRITAYAYPCLSHTILEIVWSKCLHTTHFRRKKKRMSTGEGRYQVSDCICVWIGKRNGISVMVGTWTEAMWRRNHFRAARNTWRWTEEGFGNRKHWIFAFPQNPEKLIRSNMAISKNSGVNWGALSNHKWASHFCLIACQCSLSIYESIVTSCFSIRPLFF